MKLFVDSGAFIALTSPEDEYHSAAVSFYRDSRDSGARFFTTNLVVCETMNCLKGTVSHAVAVRFGENLKKAGFPCGQGRRRMSDRPLKGHFGKQHIKGCVDL
jgi:predicted nucleic acid-binding protein